jgi:ABC-type taurine transport system ATPase subunit
MSTIKELQQRRDIWPIVSEHIPEAISLAHASLDDVLSHPELINHLERKFRKGEAEHQRAWLDRAETTDPDWLILEAAEEILDYILYQAMYIILITANRETQS